MPQVALAEEQIANGRRFVERFAADGQAVQAVTLLLSDRIAVDKHTQK